MVTRVESCAPGVSFFQLIADVWHGAGGREPLHRICTMMRWMRARSVVIESVDGDFEEYARISEETRAIKTRLSCKVKREIRKLTFLTTETRSGDSLKDRMRGVKAAADRAFLGYAIVVNLELPGGIRKTYLFEAVIRDLCPGIDGPADAILPNPPPAYYLHVQKHFDCHTLKRDKKYRITGTFYRQQNSITNVCAHACAIMLLNNSKETATPLTCEDVNRMIDLDHVSRVLQVDKRFCSNWQGEEGISTLELSNKVFASRGYQSVPYIGPDLSEFAYGFIESGYPVLLTFATPRGNHVVAVVGHTCNPHSWFPSAFPSYGPTNPPKRYISSLSWIDDFLVHDDNLGMQLALPCHFLSTGTRKRDPTTSDAPEGFAPLEAIGILPQTRNAKLPAISAEKTAFKILRQVLQMIQSHSGSLPKRSIYIEHLLDLILAGEKAAVLRTSLVARDAYLKHLRQKDNRAAKYTSTSIQKIHQHFTKDAAWLIEVTTPDLYVGNLSKLIDVLLDPTVEARSDADPSDLNKALLMLRFPDALFVPEKFLSNQIAFHPPIPLQSVKGHMSLFHLPLLPGA